MALVSMVLVSVGLTLGQGKPAADPGKKELEKLQGSWKLVMPAEGEGKLTFKEDKYTFNFGGMMEEGTMKFDPTKKPKTVDVKITAGMDTGKKQFGLYELEGDMLRLCFAPAGMDEKARPKELAEKAPDQFLFVFQRDKK